MKQNEKEEKAQERQHNTVIITLQHHRDNDGQKKRRQKENGFFFFYQLQQGPSFFYSVQLILSFSTLATLHYYNQCQHLNSSRNYLNMTGNYTPPSLCDDVLGKCHLSGAGHHAQFELFFLDSDAGGHTDTYPNQTGQRLLGKRPCIY